ncbi:enoyl-CoA hydratase/isomerase family protein [Granulosicoccus antarcticus]|uniref:Short-chain-enoyl-CoA hydratase n=1 Tax=Granulosicoccus antarcticus IMCC3135 TaxID=1192854 RepID=A0A2Z2NIT2_9GAMM|nr:enoyl-CoA hydratase/isomerase family protein [Granulosicoccus antarcticus]ASJ70973.1 Short-chain-enoyl-CoA hydratase [Granulosicoccus antarcticus IMCC3135]
MNENNELLFEQQSGIGIITFNRPEARNALTFGMYETLATICESILDHSVDIRALIITGAGDKAFAAGTDISQFRDFSSADDALNYERTMDRVMGVLESLPIPTIAAIRGACTGGGAAIAACCDLRVASEDIKYGFPIARTLGNCLSLSNLSRLVELLGAARTRDILLTARLITKDEALATLLINECVADPLNRAMELATTLQQHAPLTMAASKEGLRRLREHAADIEGDDLIVQCYTSEDFREGMDAFLAKRKPQWRGQ